MPLTIGCSSFQFNPLTDISQLPSPAWVPTILYLLAVPKTQNLVCPQQFLGWSLLGRCPAAVFLTHNPPGKSEVSGSSFSFMWCTLTPRLSFDVAPLISLESVFPHHPVLFASHTPRGNHFKTDMSLLPQTCSLDSNSSWPDKNHTQATTFPP